MNFFNIETVALRFLGYEMSYLELLGTLFNLISVILVARRNIWTWPTGIVGVILFFFLFHQAHLYSDMFEQVYFFATGIWGWWVWSREIPADGAPVSVRFSSPRFALGALFGTLAISVAMGALMSRIHLFLPAIFTEAAELPFLDALTTIASFVATWLMIQRRTECWLYWIAVDVIGIGLYAYKDLLALSILYGIFLVLASWGFRLWLKRPAMLTA